MGDVRKWDAGFKLVEGMMLEDGMMVVNEKNCEL